LPAAENGAYDNARGKANVRVTIRFLGPVFFVLLLSTPALAQPAAPEPEPAPATNARSGQKYDGVAPGAGTKNPLPQAPDGGPYLVWTGFQMTAGGSRVFLQTTRSVMFDVKHGGSGKASKPYPHGQQPAQD
jgi:hypothetical protein